MIIKSSQISQSDRVINREHIYAGAKNLHGIKTIGELAAEEKVWRAQSFFDEIELSLRWGRQRG